MKIHIVKKGDTLWEISKSYGVDFEQVKQLNSHLATPDMIMPGMKIKIPSSSKTVKKESMAVKETKKEAVKQPYKDTSPKPLPVIKEDDKEKPKPVKPEMPQMPEIHSQVQMPIMEQDFYTTINFPEMPQYSPEPKKEQPKKEAVKPMPLPQPMPMPEVKPQPMPMPEAQPQQMPMQMMVPMCCHIVHPCYPPMEFPVMAHMAEGFGPHHHMPHPQFISPGEFHGPPNMPMPGNPGQLTGKSDCGCGGQATNMEYPTPPFLSGNQEFSSQQPAFNPQQTQANNLYPPQFGNTSMNNYSYPSPPAYPDFSGYDKREKEDDSKNE
ncbi:SafA/ExsA family spore coat assembly protein [Virgibacillus profundi]|uniref:SafA/ExsA family spore coat assembly protein n=1 Tax=Virgibacillus profundi TaxID=2024555 RepID=UPI0013FE2032|nr:SafA/ExsA family spore coat assembly protein [Virgibacillus profundi]